MTARSSIILSNVAGEGDQDEETSLMTLGAFMPDEDHA